MNSAMGSALTIGNTAIDEFYREGTLETKRPGGTAFNVATWFHHYGFQSSLCSTIGADFPELGTIDTSRCTVAETESPRCHVMLNDSDVPEDRSWQPGEFRFQELDTIEERFDLVFLTSGKTEYQNPFTTVTAAVKGFALDPLIGDYQPEQLSAYLHETDYLFSNRNERRVLEQKLDHTMQELPLEYDLQAAVVTSAERVIRYEPDGSVHTTTIDPLTTPIDTTGAGDAFAATFVTEMVNEGTADTATQAAHKAAKRTITTIGAHPFTGSRDK